MGLEDLWWSLLKKIETKKGLLEILIICFEFLGGIRSRTEV